MIQFILSAILVYLFIEFLCYWIPLLAFLYPNKPTTAHRKLPAVPPYLYVVIPSRNAEASIPDLMDCIRHQDYPSDRFKVLMVIDSFTGDSDHSVAVAKRSGMEVYERRDPILKLKGAAVNEALMQHIRFEAWDAMVLLDVDARFDPRMFKRLSGYLIDGAKIVQGSTRSKNVNSNSVTRIGDAVQAVIRVHQSGRARLGLDPILIGSHGYALQREVLEAVDWQSCNSRHMGDDLELNLKRFLKKYRIVYAPDVIITNDLPEQLKGIRIQRRRWSALSFEALPEFAWPLLKRAMRGDWRALDILFGLLLLPSFAALFGSLSLFSLATWLMAWPMPSLRPFAWMASGLWLLDVFYFVIAFRVMPNALRINDWSGLVRFLIVRCWAVVEGIILACRTGAIDRWPTTHKSDAELLHAAPMATTFPPADGGPLH